MEDFVFDHGKGHRIRLVDRGELENGAMLKTGEREIYVSQSLMDLYDDYLYEVLDELDLDSNFVFVKLRGKDVGKPMEYWNVESLFKRLKKKKGINVKRGNKMLGLPKGEVFLVLWTEEWNKNFLSEKEKIQDEIGEYIMNIHHIGSTSVKHLSAKPIIDIAIEIKDFKDGANTSSPLEKLGYSYRGTNILPDRHYFSKGEPRTHQIHMLQCGNKHLLEQLKFRDYLRDNDEARIEYERLKLNLAKLNKNNRQKYTEEKTTFIRTILGKI